MYIHQHTCISPQQTGNNTNLENVIPSREGMHIALEPVLEGIPPGMLRRMSKAVRMGIGAGLPLIKTHQINGIIVGTANGGMEDCIKFLNQIVDYEEGLLTPGNFVQSTPNAIAGQISLITKNQSYNATHVHNGLAFENALLDTMLLVRDDTGGNYLVGGVDEISSYNYNIDYLAGWYDKTLHSGTLYTVQKKATIAGEGAAMFLVNGKAENAIAHIAGIEFFQSSDPEYVKKRFADFLDQHQPDMHTLLFLSGENGDMRHLPFYESCETLLDKNIPVARFKHITGEYPTASSFGLWLACYALQSKQLPEHFYKTKQITNSPQNIILYNQYQGKQHSFIFVTI